MNTARVVVIALSILMLFVAGDMGQGQVMHKAMPPPGIQVFSTHVPGVFPAVDGRWIAFQTDEGTVGLDLNGDGFVTPGMWVIQCWDRFSKKLVNTQQEGIYPSISKGIVAFDLYEQNGGNPQLYKDWNQDGDIQDYIVAYYDLSTGVMVNTLLDGRYPDMEGGRIAFHTYESSVGPLPGTDLNGDLDTNDPVIRYYTLSTGKVTNTQAAGVDASISGNTVVFSTWESWCWDPLTGMVETGLPGPDLNLDGDVTDYLLRWYTVGAGKKWANQECQYPTVDQGVTAFCHDEMEDDGPLDLDTDTDTIDMVLHTYDLNSGAVRNTMFPLTSPPTVKGRFIAFDLEEIYLGFSGPGTELNGNGFHGDHIVCIFDRQTGAFTATGVAGFCKSGDSLDGNCIVFTDQSTGLVGWLIFH